MNRANLLRRAAPLIVVLGACLAVRTAAAQADPPSDAAVLVAQLGDDSFQTREAATLKLARMGVEAKPALLTGLASNDAEVRLRCRRVLEIVLDLDFRARIERFAADTEGRDDHDVPGWDTFRKLTGDLPGSRTLYVEVLEAEPHLIEVLGSAPQSLPEMIQLRVQQWNLSVKAARATRQQPSISLGSIVALLFVTAHPDVRLPDNLQATTTNYLNQQAFQTAMNAGPRVELLKNLMSAWIRRGDGPQYQLMNLALRYQLPVAVEPAVTLIRQGQAQPTMQMQAMIVLARFGGKEHIPLLETQLKDEQSMSPRSKNVTLPQIRDVALAALLKLTDQKLADYGFERAQEASPGVMTIQTLGFNDEAKRTAAHEKWVAWRAEHAGELPPPEAPPEEPAAEAENPAENPE